MFRRCVHTVGALPNIALPFTLTFTHVTSPRAPGQAERQASAPPFYGRGPQAEGKWLPPLVRKQRQGAAPGLRGFQPRRRLQWRAAAAVHRRATFLGVTQASEQELGDTQRAPGDTQLTPTKAGADGSHLLCWAGQHAGHSRNSSKAFCFLHGPPSF